MASLIGHSQALLAARRSRGWSQLQLVAALEAAARDRGHRLPKRESLLTMLSRWERGHRHPDALYRGLLRAALGREPAELFGLPEVETAASSVASIDVTSPETDIASELDPYLDGAVGVIDKPHYTLFTPEGPRRCARGTGVTSCSVASRPMGVS